MVKPEDLLSVGAELGAVLLSYCLPTTNTTPLQLIAPDCLDVYVWIIDSVFGSRVLA